MSFRAAFCFEEREVISRELVKEDSSFRSIARLIGRDFSAVAREVKRNGGREDYRAVAAQQRCDLQRLRPRPCKLEANQRLHDEVNKGLVQKWSPQQISQRLLPG